MFPRKEQQKLYYISQYKTDQYNSLNILHVLCRNKFNLDHNECIVKEH